MKKRKYTSHPCSEETKKKLRDRVILPEWKEKLSRALIGHVISQETRDKISKSMTGKKQSETTKNKRRGKNSHWWKGGITSENDKIRKSLSMKMWKAKVFERDKFTCKKYPTVGEVKLNAHHIMNFADFPDLRLEIDNGITLSEKAHIEFHKIYGKKNNNREQLEEFLNIKN